MAEHKRLQLFLAGVAAGVVGVIAITVLDLTWSTANRAPNLILSLLIFAVSLAVMYQWKSKLATPVVLAIGAAIGAVAVR